MITAEAVIGHLGEKKKQTRAGRPTVPSNAWFRLRRSDRPRRFCASDVEFV